MTIFNKLDNYFIVSADRQTFFGFEMTANFRDTSPLRNWGSGGGGFCKGMFIIISNNYNNNHPLRSEGQRSEHSKVNKFVGPKQS